MSIMATLFVALAGGVGAAGRMLMAQWMGKLPWGILTANVLASFIAGFAALALQYDAVAAALVIGGLCGGLSTFSSFAAQTVEYFKADQFARAVFNILLNFLLPLIAVIGGAIVASLLLK